MQGPYGNIAQMRAVSKFLPGRKIWFTQQRCGESWQYQRIRYPLARNLQEEIALVRRFCNEMLSLMPEVIKLGGHVPEDPISVIEKWLSMAENLAEPD